ATRPRTLPPSGARSEYIVMRRFGSLWLGATGGCREDYERPTCGAGGRSEASEGPAAGFTRLRRRGSGGGDRVRPRPVLVVARRATGGAPPAAPRRRPSS